MFIHRPLNLNANSLNALRRRLSASVSKLMVVKRQAPQAVAVPSCENGVCVLDWKPQRPAA